MWHCVHYLFCPVRLNDEDIPTPIKIASLRKWLTIILTLPFCNQYAQKYSETIKDVSIISISRGKLKESPQKLEGITSKVDVKWVIEDTISDYYSTPNNLQQFARKFMHIALLANIEILKKYNPCIQECVAINPAYEGAWVVPLDPMYCDQMFKIGSLTKLVEMK